MPLRHIRLHAAAIAATMPAIARPRFDAAAGGVYCRHSYAADATCLRADTPLEFFSCHVITAFMPLLRCIATLRFQSLRHFIAADLISAMPFATRYAFAAFDGFFSPRHDTDSCRRFLMASSLIDCRYAIDTPLRLRSRCHVDAAITPYFRRLPVDIIAIYAAATKMAAEPLYSAMPCCYR